MKYGVAQVIIEKLENIQFSIDVVLASKDELEDRISQNCYLDGRYGRAHEIATRLYELENWMARVQRDLAPIERNRVKF